MLQKPSTHDLQLLQSETLPDNALWLEELDLTEVSQGYGEAKAREGMTGAPITIGGRKFEHGVGIHTISRFTVHLHGQASRFLAMVGLDDGRMLHGAHPTEGYARFEVYLDDKLVEKTKLFQGSGPAEPIAVDVTGAHKMDLRVNDGGFGTHWGHASWGAAMIIMADGATRKPETPKLEVAHTLSLAKRPQPTASESPIPVGPTVVGSTPGRDFHFRLGAISATRTRWSCNQLPAGLVLDTDQGVLSGRLAVEGDWVVPFTVENSAGTSEVRIRIVGKPRSLSLTPPMGWNSWNVWGMVIDGEKIKAAADALISTGLADVGYHYVNIDDGWQTGRNPDGTIRVQQDMGDMKALADWLHARGMKLGTYSSPGPKTCGGREGSYQHEFIDARTYAEWSIDYLKYDLCSYATLMGGKPNQDDEIKPYALMREALDSAGRDIVYSLCQYGRGAVWSWGNTKVGAQLWRTEGDIVDYWYSMIAQALKVIALDPPCRPGAWHDPDMLVIGHVGWGPQTHPTRLSRNEQRSHISIWSLLPAPLLLGCDLTKLDDWTLDLLLNPEVVALNQDPLGAPARRLRAINTNDGFHHEVWVRALADGSTVIGLFNFGTRSLSMEVTWAELGLNGTHKVRDLWERTDLGIKTDGISQTVPARCTYLYKVSRG
ncbi:MAG: NPCBM/NEW2 domain-containing protein [Verrucomicrobiota bacterium]|nr:NPCBM/NEW2 domain-containing protein [Verrucomicrobiota bacterium]